MQRAALILVSLGMLAGCGGSSSSGLLRVGSSQSAFDSKWSQTAQGCSHSTCEYTVTHGDTLQVEVSFLHGKADGMQVLFDPDSHVGTMPDPSPATYWKFIKSFVPKSARLQRCKRLTNTGPQGPIDACVYAYKGTTVLAAHWLRPSATLQIGQVDLNYDLSSLTVG